MSHSCNSNALYCWNVDWEKGGGEDLSHLLPLPQTRAFPWVFQLTTEEWHCVQDILPRVLKLWSGSPGQTLLPPSPAFFESWEHQSRLVQGSEGFVWAGQAGSTWEGENIPSPFAVYSQFTSSSLASSAQITSCDWCILLRSAACRATDLSWQARGVIGSADGVRAVSCGAALLCSLWADSSTDTLGWAVEGALSLLEWWRKRSGFVSYLFKTYLGWKWRLSMFNLSLYQNNCLAETIGLPVA